MKWPAPLSVFVSRRAWLRSGWVVLALASTFTGQAAQPSTPAATKDVQFMRDIAPILSKYCFSCHGPDEPGGDLRLDSYEGMTKGDHPAVAPGEPEYSGMLHRLLEEDSSSRMPRDDDPLPAATIEMIRQWILAGAKFDGPDPKTPYKVALETPAPAPAAPAPVPPPPAPSDRKQDEQPKADAPKK